MMGRVTEATLLALRQESVVQLLENRLADNSRRQRQPRDQKERNQSAGWSGVFTKIRQYTAVHIGSLAKHYIRPKAIKARERYHKTRSPGEMLNTVFYR